jgi:YggT family protein
MGFFLLLQEFGFSISALLANTVSYTGTILIAFIIANVLISFFPRYPSARPLQIVYDAVRAVADPILRPIRGAVPSLNLGGFSLDLSPIIAIFGISIAQRLLLTVVGSFIGPVTG